MLRKGRPGLIANAAVNLYSPAPLKISHSTGGICPEDAVPALRIIRRVIVVLCKICQNVLHWIYLSLIHICGLAQVNVVLSMLMGGCSGSANADCAMQSKMLVPEMEKRGYSKAFSAAITAASSAATPVIPPGVNLIVFCLIAQASLGRTFAAGYVPGILMSI